MITLLTQVVIQEILAPAQPQMASRRSWLKGLSALLGTGLPATPTASLASPAVLAEQPLPSSNLLGSNKLTW